MPSAVEAVISLAIIVGFAGAYIALLLWVREHYGRGEEQ